MKLKQAFLIAGLLGSEQIIKAWGFLGCDIFPDKIYRSQKDLTTIIEAIKNNKLQFLNQSNWENGKYAQLAGFDFKVATTTFLGGSLRNINLAHANLYQTRFTDIDLRGANLSYAILTYASFYRANLTKANLQHATIYRNPSDDKRQYFEFAGATIEGACIAGIKEFKEVFKDATGTPLTTFKACKDAGFDVNPKDLEKEAKEEETRKARLAAEYKKYQDSVNSDDYYKNR